LSLAPWVGEMRAGLVEQKTQPLPGLPFWLLVPEILILEAFGVVERDSAAQYLR